MTEYTGKTVTVNTPASKIVERFSDLSSLQTAFDNMDESQKKQVGEVILERDAIVINNAMVGKIRFQVTELSDDVIRLSCASPMPMDMAVNMKAANAEGTATTLTTVVSVDVPMMLKPIVGPMIQKAADGMASMITRVATIDVADTDKVL